MPKTPPLYEPPDDYDFTPEHPAPEEHRWCWLCLRHDQQTTAIGVRNGHALCEGCRGFYRRMTSDYR
jgi:hypothetical protein